jgi:glycerol-3-phosphate dehydrogenase subunit B
VLIAGAGIAGLAAAFQARRAGCDVTVVAHHPGASELGSGAVDDVPWERMQNAARTLGVLPAPRPIAPEVAEFARSLGCWDLPAQSRTWIATAAGRIRPARGRDRALLDLGALERGDVLLPRVDRAGWDADAIAAGLAAEPFARSRQIRFVAVDLPVLRFEEEHRIPDGDLAARHDDAARLGWLAARLLEGIGRRGPASAVLLGPWLGMRAARAEALAQAVGVPVGEVLVGVGSPAGLRFEAARDRLLREIGARVCRDRVVSVDGEDGGLSVTLAREKAPIVVDAMVLSVGGLAGGGVRYVPPEHDAVADLPPGGRIPFVLSLRAGVGLCAQITKVAPALAQAPLGITSSLHGPELDLLAWPSDGQLGALESVGVCCDGVRAASGISAAGDVIAGRPRTVLAAVSSGLAAGSASAGLDRAGDRTGDRAGEASLTAGREA